MIYECMHAVVLCEVLYDIDLHLVDHRHCTSPGGSTGRLKKTLYD